MQRTDAMLAGGPAINITEIGNSLRAPEAMAAEYGMEATAWSRPLISKAALMEAILEKSTLERAPRFIVAAINKGETVGHYFNAIIDASGRIRFIDGRALPNGAQEFAFWDIYYTMLKTSGSGV